VTGCYSVTFGVESGSARLRNELLKKRLSDESILQCAAFLHKYKIPFATYNITGLPGETLQDAWDTVNINVQIKPNWAFYSIYQPLPKTELVEFAIDKGYLSFAEANLQYEHFEQGILEPTLFLKSGAILHNNPEGKKMLRLKNSANFIIKMPFLRNFVSNVVLNLPLDGIYNLIYNFMYFILYYVRITYNQGLVGFVRTILFTMKIIKDQKS